MSEAKKAHYRDKERRHTEEIADAAAAVTTEK